MSLIRRYLKKCCQRNAVFQGSLSSMFFQQFCLLTSILEKKGTLWQNFLIDQRPVNKYLALRNKVCIVVFLKVANLSEIPLSHETVWRREVFFCVVDLAQWWNNSKSRAGDPPYFEIGMSKITSSIIQFIFMQEQLAKKPSRVQSVNKTQRNWSGWHMALMPIMLKSIITHCLPNISSFCEHHSWILSSCIFN